jgi:hypothetical protein
VSIVVRKGTEKMNAPNDPGTPRRPPPRSEAEAKLLKESISQLRGRADPERKTLLGWKLLRIMRTRMNQAAFYWASRSLWSK